jgi:Transposase family tnp2
MAYLTNNSLDGKSLGASDHDLLRVYTLKVEDHLSDRTFNRFAKAFPTSGHDTLKVTKRRVRSLAGFQPIRYSCCINSCICFVGPYENLTECPNCKEARYGPNEKPRKYYDYLPIIPRLKAQMANSAQAAKMRYRAEFVHEPGVVKDVFDGSHYRSLLDTRVPSSEAHPFFYFSDERDIALGLSTDGFAPFKKRSQTCWPIILFNYNIPPQLRFRKKYCIHVATVPGPKKPWDWDSFCWPLAEELIQLEMGIKAFDAVALSIFLLHAYLILAFGDIPAMALVMRMKGSNGISPCRICEIKGVRFNARIHYVPLRRDKIPGAQPRRYYPSDLPIRTHERLLEQASEVEMAPTNTIREKLSKRYGIKGVPVLSSISAMSFPASFPFDFMHLIWENLIPNLIEFWTGSFKDLDHEGKDYVIESHIWKQIGSTTAACGATIPSAFGARVPDIAAYQSMSAEMYANWTLFIAPIVLRGRFKRPCYYKHFLQLVELLKLCLALEISETMLNRIEEGFRLWVEEYEK